VLKDLHCGGWTSSAYSKHKSSILESDFDKQVPLNHSIFIEKPSSRDCECESDENDTGFGQGSRSNWPKHRVKSSSYDGESKPPTVYASELAFEDDMSEKSLESDVPEATKSFYQNAYNSPRAFAYMFLRLCYNNSHVELKNLEGKILHLSHNQETFILPVAIP
jgi:hypothetical protein